MTDVLVRRVVDGFGNILAAEVSARLIDATGTQRVGWQVSTGKPVTEYQNELLYSGSGDLTLVLIQQDDIAVDEDGTSTYYRIEIKTKERTEIWDVQVPYSATPVELADLVGAASIPPGSLIESRLLPADASPGEMAQVDANGDWVAVPPPSGTGDMQSGIYDPTGVTDDCFNLGNMAGVLDGGTFM